MTRMWMVWSVILGLALVLVACGPKPAPTTPDDMAVETTPEPPKEVEPPPAPPTTEDQQESPWWENKDLVELNDEAARRGFHPNVYFELDQSNLTAEAREKLEDNARFLKENPELNATVEGHCDERGTVDYNLALGERRANSAVDYMGSLGVNRDRFRTISYGEERPVCTQGTESCWARNRRAYFVLGFGG